MYCALPGLLDGNPFSESVQLRVPGGVRVILGVLSETLKLLKVFLVHPDISRQLCAYLFYFINASIFNALMERGERERERELYTNRTSCSERRREIYIF